MGEIMRHIIILLICMATAVVWYRYDIAGLRQTNAFLKGQEANLKEQANILIHRQELLEDLVVQFSEVKDVLTHWQDKFIKDRNLKELILEIKAIGHENKLYFKVFSPKMTTKENNYSKQPFDVVIIGNYVQTKRFIDQITRLPWMVVINDLRITRPYGYHVLVTQMELDVYVREANAGRAQHQTSTLPAPLAFKVRQNSSIVPPVVMTSSTTATD